MVRATLAFAAAAALLSGHATAARFSIANRHAEIAARHQDAYEEWDEECEEEDDEDDEDYATPTASDDVTATATYVLPTDSVPATITLSEDAEMTTSTVYSTSVRTISDCPEEVTDCPYGEVVTETVPIYTTICPVEPQPTKPPGKPEHGGDKPGKPEEEYPGKPGKPEGEHPEKPGKPEEEYPEKPGKPEEEYPEKPGKPEEEYPEKPGKPEEEKPEVPVEETPDVPEDEVVVPPAPVETPEATPPPVAGAATLSVSVLAVLSGAIAMLL